MLTDLKTALRPALVLAALFALLLGLAYPLALTVLGQALFPAQANGSLIRQGGRVIGSELIGQRFARDAYFHGRPSAAGSDGYDASASAGSNLGPTSRALAERVRSDADALALQNGRKPASADLLTASGSGLDPHVSPQSALYQAPRVAHARGLPAETVQALVRAQTEPPLLGFLGEPRVNVLVLNRALDRTAAQR